MLDRVLGPGRSIVRVDATLNFEKIDREREIFDPAATVVRSEVRTETSDPRAAAPSENSTDQLRDQPHGRAHRGRDRRHQAPSRWPSSSTATTSPAPTAASPSTRPLSDEELGQLRRIVQTAVGLNSVRGDQIEVVNMQFRQQEDLGGGGRSRRRLDRPGQPVRRTGPAADRAGGGGADPAPQHRPAHGRRLRPDARGPHGRRDRRRRRRGRARPGALRRHPGAQPTRWSRTSRTTPRRIRNGWPRSSSPGSTTSTWATGARKAVGD